MKRYEKFLRESFDSPEDLLEDHPKASEILEVFDQLQIFKNLVRYTPQLVGTQPLFIDTPTSDLDVLFYCENFSEFRDDVEWHFKNEDRFNIETGQSRGEDYLAAHFEKQGFAFELFAQKIPSRMQDAFKHMVVEGRLLHHAGDSAVQAVRNAKLEGMKTEPAFAKVFKIEGDPYTELLNLYLLEDLLPLARQHAQIER